VAKRFDPACVRRAALPQDEDNYRASIRRVTSVKTRYFDFLGYRPSRAPPCLTWTGSASGGDWQPIELNGITVSAEEAEELKGPVGQLTFVVQAKP
jgi:hypothetical protein